MSMYVLFFLYIPVGVHPGPAWALKPWIMRLGQTNIKLLKGRRSFLYNSKGKKITWKNAAICILCANMALWHGWEDEDYGDKSDFCLLKLSHLTVLVFFFLSFFFSTRFKQLSLIAAVPVVAVLMVSHHTWSDSQHLSNKMHHHFLGNC